MNLLWDILAGLSVAGLLLPEAVAYSLIAGVTPAHAILAAVCGLIVYALLGRSRFAIVAPTSSSAAILAASAASLALPDPAQKMQAMAALVLLSGLGFLGFGFAKLGNLSSFVSRAVLHGFAFGLAITIVIKQLPLILGVDGVGGSVYQVITGLIARWQDWNLTSFWVGVAGLIGLLVLKKVRGLPAAFMVLIAGIAVSMAADLGQYKVHLLGTIHFDALQPSLPSLPAATWLRLLELAPPLFLILFAESWGSIRNLALLHNEPVDPNRELLGLGAANIASSLLQGLAVGAGFSASSANESAGAQTRLAGFCAAMALVALVYFATPLIAHLPEPILAAVVIAALSHALSPAPLLHLWKIDRDQYIAIAATLAVLTFGVLLGMLSAIALSLLAMISRLSTPTVVQLGQLGVSHDFVDIARFPEAKTEPRILILRPAHPIFFANAEGIFGAMAQQVSASHAACLIISFEESADFDSTSMECLTEFKRQMTQNGVQLYFARVRQKIADAMALCGDPVLADSARQTQSVADAYALAKTGLLTPPG